MEAEIRLMLVDDHDVVRTGIKAFLQKQEGFQVVAEAGSGREALEIAAETWPDVIIMDITMPDMDGLEATRQLKTLCPDCHVLALTVHEDRQYFFEMLAAGASGYLSKQAAADELVTAIRAVAQGNVYLQPALASWLLEDYRRLTLQTNIDGKVDKEKKSFEKGVLSKRELQVLGLVAQGLTSPEISRNLNLSPKTVARHRERIMKKLNLHTSTELVRYAIKAGLISL